MTFEEAKVKFSAETTCPACGHVGKRSKPWYVLRGPNTGKMQWDCPECGYPENSGTHDPVLQSDTAELD